MQRNYMSMSNYGGGYQPMAPFAMTQPEAIPSWMPSPVASVPRAFPMASAAAPAFNYETDMAGLMPTPTPLGSTPTNAQIFSGIGGAAAPGGQRSIFDGFLQQRNLDGTTSGGYGTAALGALQGIGNLYLGMQQYNVAKDTLANNKAQFERNFAAQKATTNASLEDRQRARVASNAGAYQSVGDYMNQNGVR